MLLRYSLTILLFIGILPAQSQDLQYEFLFEVEAKLDAPIQIGKLPKGERTIFPFSKGTFEGPDMKGTIKNFGADWSLKIDETTSLLDIRGLYTMESGELIYVQARGFLHINEDNTIYLRSTPVFETSAKGFTWLNHTVAVGVGEITKSGVKFKIFTIQ